MDDFGFEICTISEVYDNYIILKEHPYQEYAEEGKKQLEDLLKTSKLPEDVDKEFSNKLLIEIRNEFYSKSDVD